MTVALRPVCHPLCSFLDVNDPDTKELAVVAVDVGSTLANKDVDVKFHFGRCAAHLHMPLTATEQKPACRPEHCCSSEPLRSIVLTAIALAHTHASAAAILQG